MNRLVVLFLTSCCLLTACSEDFFETTVNLELPDQEPKITLNCLAEANGVVRLQLTQSKGILDESNNFAPIRNATVQLFANGNAVGVFAYEGRTIEIPVSYSPEPMTVVDSAYYLFESPPQAGQTLPPYQLLQPNVTYTVKATVAGLTPVEASMTMPSPTELQNVVVRTDAVEEETESGVPRYYLPIDIAFDDPNDGQNHYYAIQLLPYSLVDYDGDGEATDTINTCKCFYSNEVVFENANEPNPFGNNSNQSYTYYYDDALFSNRLFKGETLNFRLYTDYFAGYDLFRVKIILTSMDKEQYDYLRTRRLQQQVGENPFAEPVSVFNNVENGFGVFGGSSRSTVVVDF